jgi:hypothetical protein
MVRVDAAAEDQLISKCQRSSLPMAVIEVVVPDPTSLREFVGLTDGAIGVEESLLESIDGGATPKDQIVADSTCAENSRCWTPACFLSSAVKEGVKRVSTLGTEDEIVGDEGIG